ncbi:MAG: Gfo/Idh/MocA family oxidoreductase, partial [Desulfobacterales bacterium]
MNIMDDKDRKIKVGIIGTGFIADLHADVLKRIRNLSIVGCCDISRGQAESFAKRWNLPHAFTD